MSSWTIPKKLLATCQSSPKRQAWLRDLPRVLTEAQKRWQLTLKAHFDGDEVSCSWVAVGRRPDGAHVVLKVGMPHMEAEDEIAAMRFWDGDPTAKLLDADETVGAMLLERCVPGTPLRALPEPEQDTIFADLLEVPHERVHLWTFARAAAESRDAWHDDDAFDLARRLAP